MLFPSVLSMDTFSLPCALSLFLTKSEQMIMQLHKACQSIVFQCLASDSESCFLDVTAWMLSIKLKLNGEKTEAMLVGSGQSTNLTKAESIQIG